MADNTTLPGTGEIYASDEVGGVKIQRIKVVHGAENVNDGDVSNANPLPVLAKGGFVSTNNSSTSTLAGDALFTGVGDDVTHFSSVSVTWNSDVASAASGMSMQFSTDNVNWDTRIPVESHSDALQVDHGGDHRLPIIAKFFRVVYTNGSGAQASFRLQTIYHSDNSFPLVSRADQQLNTTDDCAITRPITDIQIDLARIQITGQRSFFFFGFNADLDAAWEDIWAQGGDINWQTTAAKIAVSSSDAADTAAGLGVRQVEIHGLSALGADQSEVITMNGTTEVESTLDYVRVNLMHNENVGTYGGSHQGDVTCRVTSAGAKTGEILSMMTGQEGNVDTSVQYGSGEAGNGFFSVPLGKVAYLRGGTVTVDGTKTADVTLYERDGLLTVVAPYEPRRVLWDIIGHGGFTAFKFDSHIKIKSLADVWFRALGNQVNTSIQVFLEFYLLDENSDGA